MTAGKTASIAAEVVTDPAINHKNCGSEPQRHTLGVSRGQRPINGGDVPCYATRASTACATRYAIWLAPYSWKWVLSIKPSGGNFETESRSAPVAGESGNWRRAAPDPWDMRDFTGLKKTALPPVRNPLAAAP